MVSVNVYAVCPVGSNDDHLTIHRVMQNFGRFTLAADSISLRSANPNETITDQQLNTAIENLGSAIDCAQAVLNNPAGDLLPDHASALSGDELKEYISDFVYFMNDFHDGLIEYRTLFQNILAKKPQERDFQPIRDKCKELDDLVEHAHHKV